eukprot:Skav213518  [mRNA]  locus=scaffold656:156855:158254:+ [translate_table: standard]
MSMAPGDLENLGLVPIEIQHDRSPHGERLIEKQELEDETEEQLDSLFEVLDTDKDGFISFEEFVDFVFSTGDKEFLTEAELEKMRQLSAKGFKQQKQPKENERDCTESLLPQIPQLCCNALGACHVSSTV